MSAPEPKPQTINEDHDLVECIANALDARGPYTGNHSRRVSDMACILCRHLPRRRRNGLQGITFKKT